MKKIGFIGAGNMGGALAKAVCAAGFSEYVYICEKNKEKAQKVCTELGVKSIELSSLIHECDIIFLGVKPQFITDTVGDVVKHLENRKDKLFVSMAAGVAINKLESIPGFSCPIIRIMPNTPVGVGEGMILACENDMVTEDMHDAFCRIMASAGELDFIDEKLIDAASAVSGCGPAFVYIFIEALADGGVKCGLSRESSLKYAIRTVLGASKLAAE